MKSIISIIIFLTISLYSISQTGVVRGFVYEKTNGEPIMFCNVYLKNTTYGGSTDINGFFSMPKVPVGSYTLIATYLGFDTLKMAITIKSGDIITKKLFLEKGAIELQSAQISAEKYESKTEVKTSVVKITPKQLKKMPSVGGAPDIVQYMQIVPGVVFTGEQGGQLYIRGGSPIQNMVLLDGMIVYNPFHSIGLFSVFDTDIIRNADIYTGGFNATYGGRISSVMDISTREGNKKKMSGKLTTTPFMSKLLIEGPLKKQTLNNTSSTSFILSGKTSYLDKTSQSLYSYIDKDGLPYTFTDLYAKLSTESQNGSKLNVFGFNFDDQVNYQEVSDLNWNSYGVGANFVLLPAGTNTLMQGLFAYSEYQINLIETDNAPRSSLISGFNGGLNFTYFINKSELKYGIEMIGNKTDFIFKNAANRTISEQKNNTDLAGYIKYKFASDKSKFIFEPSFRLHYYASQSKASPEPRFGIKYKATDKFRLKLSAGVYSQNLLSATSDRDVVTLFYGFLSDPQSISETFRGDDITNRLQKANHAIFGIEYDLLKYLSLNIEGYYKDFSQLININRNKIFPDDGDHYEEPDNLKKDFIIEQGYAYGVDFLLKYDYKGLYIWAVYSWGYTKRLDEVVEYFPHFDRRHNINLVVSYGFGKNDIWEINGRWNFGTGFPFTQTQGYYEQIHFDNGIHSDYSQANGIVSTILGGLNQGRLPTYDRFDLSAKRKFFVSTKTTLEAILSITNLYNQENIFYYNRIKNKKVNQLPILPSFGISLKF